MERLGRGRRRCRSRSSWRESGLSFGSGRGSRSKHLAEGRDWRLCEALLTLHAIADEACAGPGVALTASDGMGAVYRARGRELLAQNRDHSPASRRISSACCPRSAPHRAAARRVALALRLRQSSRGRVRWHKVPGRHRGTEPQADTAQLLAAAVAAAGPGVRLPAGGGLGARPGQASRSASSSSCLRRGLDLDLVDRMLVAARDEVDSVNVVVLPESAVDESELDALEALLARHGVTGLHQPGSASARRDRASSPATRCTSA